MIVNLNAFDVGEDVAALVGGTLLNLAARAISAQAMLPPEARKPVTLVVDEFHTLPGADYEQVLGELAKYGANVLLATQTLSRLDRLTDAQRTRDLRAAVFSNLDGLFAFHTSAEDAAYLAEELGGGLGRAGPARAGRLPVLRAAERRAHGRAAADVQRAAGSAACGRRPAGCHDLARCRRSATAATRSTSSSTCRAHWSASAVRVAGHELEEADEALQPETAPPNGGTPTPNGVVADARGSRTMTETVGSPTRPRGAGRAAAAGFLPAHPD